MSELITEVDKQNKIIGKGKPSSFFATNKIHRSSNLLLFDELGRLLLQKRSKNKILYPGMYSFSVSGAVNLKETHKRTIIREMKEEIGIQINCRPLFTYRFFDVFDKSFAILFIGHYQGKLTINKEEVDSVKWMTMNSIKKDLLERPLRYSPVFFYAMRKYLEQIA